MTILAAMFQRTADTLPPNSTDSRREGDPSLRSRHATQPTGRALAPQPFREFFEIDGSGRADRRHRMPRLIACLSMATQYPV